MTPPPLVADGAVAADPTDVLACRGGPSRLHRFLAEDAPAALHAVLAGLLRDPSSSVESRLVRTKLKPGRSLTATFDVTAEGDPLGTRPVTATWSTAGPRDARHDPARDGKVEADTRLRGVSGPFVRLRAQDPGTCLGVLVAPFDPAFPHVAALYDPVAAADLLPRRAGEQRAATVTVIRYRPAQRHVVRVRPLAAAGEPLAGVYAKAYVDDTGTAAARRAPRLAAALDAAGGGGRVARCLDVVDDGRVIVWREVAGQPLGAVPDGRRDLVRLAGALLRVLHDTPPAAGERSARRDAATDHAITVRATEHVGALAPATGHELRALLDAVLARLDELPGEPDVTVHGDAKCDNILVDGSTLHVLDLDRAGPGDPALDLGKLASDLRWHVPADAEPLVAALIEGYGRCPTARLERAACYDVLLQLRAAGRRVPVHDEHWADRVGACVRSAGQQLARLSRDVLP